MSAGGEGKDVFRGFSAEEAESRTSSEKDESKDVVCINLLFTFCLELKTLSSSAKNFFSYWSREFSKFTKQIFQKIKIILKQMPLQRIVNIHFLFTIKKTSTTQICEKIVMDKTKFSKYFRNYFLTKK